jgi:hypothetical protein
LFASSTEETADSFIGHPILLCNVSQRLLLLYNTMNYCWPVLGGNTVFGVFWPWPPMWYNERRTASSLFICSKQQLHLLIEVARGGKEEG